MLKLTTALVLWAAVAAAEESTYKRGDGLFPLMDSPNATTVVVEFKRAPVGSQFLVAADRVYTKRGTVSEVCTIQDGLCCPCDAKPDGRIPECGFEVTYGVSSTDGGCSQKVWGSTPYEPPMHVGPWAGGKSLARARTVKALLVQGIVVRGGKRHKTRTKP